MDSCHPQIYEKADVLYAGKPLLINWPKAYFEVALHFGERTLRNRNSQDLFHFIFLFSGRVSYHQTPAISAVMNGIGAVATTGVLAVILATKFLLGAWAVVVTIPIAVSLFLAIHRHYRYVAARLSIQGIEARSYLRRPRVKTVTHPAAVLVGQLHRGTFDALDCARLIADEVVAVHVDIGLTEREKLQLAWEDLQSDIPLEILESPYRSVGSPLTHFLALFEEQRPGVYLTPSLPAFVTRNWWEGLLHHQTAFFLKAALRAKKSQVVTTVRYYL